MEICGAGQVYVQGQYAYLGHLANWLRMREDGTAIVVSSHRIHDLADVCDRCRFLVNGRLDAEAVIFADAASHGDRTAELLAAFDRARSRA